MQRALKRVIDIAGAAAGLAVLGPLMLAVGTGILICLGRPVLFRQLRSGKHGVPFTLMKFRTMVEAGGEPGQVGGDAERLVPLGRFLRESSLDELPQLWHVLRGEMSLVGPRPLLPQYVARYSPQQRRRLDAAPGITGWSQIHGRNAVGWEKRFEQDVWYVDHWSIGLDLRILAATIRQVVQRRGVSAAGHVTMPEFMGSAPQQRSREENVLS